MNRILAGTVGTFGAVSFLALCGCSDSSNVAGNSAETGSPELAGVLYLDGGKPAALARVQCVPSHFDVFSDVLPSAYATVADDSGAYVLDSLPAGKYSLEAFDPKSGKMLLVQNIDVPDSGRVSVSDTLQSAGYVRLEMDFESLDGSEGSAVVVGTSIKRPVKVDGSVVVVDSLPADTLDLVLYLNDGNDVIDFSNIDVPAADTAKVFFSRDSVDAPADTVILKFMAPLAWPVEVDSTVDTYASDIPLALRLDSSNCDFKDFDGLEGRWEAYRVSADGTRSKSLPITPSIFDVEQEKALFWINVDSLNVTDSLELIFNTSKKSVYATDVFPTSRSYTAVYHFESGVESVSDDAEKQNYVGTGNGLKETEGVLGSGVLLDGEGYMVVEGSAASDSTRKSDFNYEYGDRFNVSLWVKLDDVNSAQTLIAKGDAQYDLRFAPDSGFVVEVFHQAEEFKDSTSDTTSYKKVAFGGADLVKADQWVFVSVNWYGNFSLSIDGVDQKVKTATVSWSGTRSEDKDFEVGRLDGAKGPCRYFKGSMDELVVTAGIRNEAWIKTSYYNQRPDEVWPKFIPVVE